MKAPKRSQISAQTVLKQMETNPHHQKLVNSTGLKPDFPHSGSLLRAAESVTQNLQDWIPKWEAWACVLRLPFSAWFKGHPGGKT